MTTKIYNIFFITKANRTEYLHQLTVEASSVKDAKAIAAERIYSMIGRHAFRLSNGKPDKGMRDFLDRARTTPLDVIYNLARRTEGCDIYGIA